MDVRDLPGMYAWSPRTACPKAEGIHIRWIRSIHITRKIHYFWHSKYLSNLSCLFMELGSHCDCRVFILLLLLHLFIQCIAVVSIIDLELFSKNMCYRFLPKLVLKNWEKWWVFNKLVLYCILYCVRSIFCVV